MESFTPYTALLGGIAIGLAALCLLLVNKQICGISGMVEGCLPPIAKDFTWRLFFLLGLVTGGIMLKAFYPSALSFEVEGSLGFIFTGGFLVGLGARWGRGCTSGHGVCGMGRLQPRSIVTTLVFLIAAIATATLLGYSGGGQ